MAKDKRTFRRYLKSFEFTISLGGKSYRAESLDYSLGGYRAVVKDPGDVTAGDIIGIDVRESNIKSTGRVVWTERHNSGLLVGIERTGLIYGNLDDFNLSDVFIGLNRGRKTGVFHLMRGGVHKSVYIDRGDMIFASSNQTEDRLGDRLFDRGIITREQYDVASELTAKVNMRIGSILVEKGYIEPRKLFVEMKHRVEDIILSLFGYGEGEFLFREGSLPTEELTTLKLSVGNLIYRGIKQVMLEEDVRRLCPSEESIVVFSSDPIALFQNLTLEEDDKRILTTVDGKKTVGELIASLEGDEKDRLRAFYALFSTKIIETHEKGDRGEAQKEETVTAEDIIGNAEENSHEIIGKINDLYPKYKDQGYYGILGLDQRASRSDIKRAYYNRAREFHPDKHYTLGEDAKEKLNAIFTYITTAYSTLNNPELRGDYDRKPSTQEPEVSDPRSRAVDSFNQGKEAFLARDYDRAIQLFSEAAYLDASVARYHYYAGLTFTRSGMHREAERAIQRAIKIEPSNADYLSEAGHVFLALDMPLRAKTNFVQALEVKPSHARALEGMGLLKAE
jgi:Flp pilus assembly protein TadD